MIPTVIETAEAVRSGERKAVDVLADALDDIAAHNDALNAFVHVNADHAREAAVAVDETVAAGGDPGPLAGAVFGVKDLEDCRDMPTSHGSLLYAGRPPVQSDSIHVARMRSAGAVPVGKTAAPEFGTLNFTKTKAFGVTRNPWAHDRTPGGSSGGSAAAVAAGIVPFATASDGGGSTRIPASFCGLVGHKPSHGRIPSPGPAGSQTAVKGVVTTTVADSARHLDVVAGPDPRDRVSLPAGLSYEAVTETLETDGLRARWSVDQGFAVTDPEVAELCGAAAQTLADAAGLDLDDEPIALSDPVRTWLSSGSLDLWFGLEEGMWPDRADDLTLYSRQGLETTESFTAPKLARSAVWRQQLQLDCAAIFEEVDVLLCPTTAVPAFDAAGPPPTEIAGREVGMAMATPFTMLANLCWNPATSVPAGLNSEGLPVGLQIMGRQHRDDVTLRLARVFEQARPWPRLSPGR